MIRLSEFESLSKLNDLKAFKLQKTFSETANTQFILYIMNRKGMCIKENISCIVISNILCHKVK